MSVLENLWSSLFDALDCGIVVLDGEQRVVGWNAWLQSASEIEATAAEGRRLEEIFPGAPLPRVKAAVSAALTARLPTLITHSLHQEIFPLKTRTRLPLIHNVLVGPVNQNRGSFCVLQIVDVTLAVERERVLRRRQNSRYDAVVDSARDVILTLDERGDIRLANPAAIRQFVQYSPLTPAMLGCAASKACVAAPRGADFMNHWAADSTIRSGRVKFRFRPVLRVAPGCSELTAMPRALRRRDSSLANSEFASLDCP